MALIPCMLQISGGAPIYLNNPIILCARSDLDPNRFLDGSVAHLALYNTALSNEQVQNVYDAYTTGPNPSPAGWLRSLTGNWQRPVRHNLLAYDGCCLVRALAVKSSGVSLQ